MQRGAVRSQPRCSTGTPVRPPSKPGLAGHLYAARSRTGHRGDLDGSERVTVQDFARILREQWQLLVSAVVIGLLTAGAIWVIRPAQYTASIALYVAAEGSQTTNAYEGGQLSQQRVTSYVELVSSPRV